jgi:hypothetical protein
MDMREESKKPQHRDDLELYFLRLVSHALRQCVQAEKQNTERQDAEDQYYGRYHHKYVGVARRSDKCR